MRTYSGHRSDDLAFDGRTPTVNESITVTVVEEAVDDRHAPESVQREKGSGTLHYSVDLLRRYWATTALIAAVLLAGLFTGALWNGVEEGSDLYADVAYGLPALNEGRWWTFFTGMFFSPDIVLYIPILLLLVVAASAHERRIGHVQTLVVAIGGQFVAGLLTALFLSLFDNSGWEWAAELGNDLDLGISAGGFALAGALTAGMQPVWRARVRVGLLGYLVAMLLLSGLLWDVEHLLAFVLGLAVGPVLIGRGYERRQLRFGRRTQRSLVALVIAVTAIARLTEALYPGTGGPFHTGGADEHSGGVTVGVVVAALLALAFADSLRRGRRLAWIIVTAISVLMLVAFSTREPSAERGAAMVGVGIELALLLVTARAFTARPARRSFRRAGRRVFLLIIALFVYTAIGFGVLRDDFEPRAGWPDMIGEFLARLFFTTTDRIEPVTDAARWFVASIGFFWAVALVVTLLALLYSSRKQEPAPDQGDQIRRLVAQHPPTNIEWMLTWKDITVWMSSDDRTAIGYELVGSVALCLADPIGPAEGREAALREFDEFCFRRGWIPCLFAAGADTAELAPSLGWKAVEVAKDSAMSLDNVEFRGKAWQDVRTALNKAGRQDIELVSTRWEDSAPVVTDQLRAISGEWVGDKALPEMGFTLGTLREANDPDVRLHLATGADGTIEGFTSWMPVSENGEVVGWTLDLMRRREHGFRPVMEFLIGASARQFHEEGYQFMSLSAAPLAKAPDSLGGSSDQELMQKLLDFLGDQLEPYYGFQSLFRFKEKFQPEHHPMYLVYPDETALAEIGLAVMRAYLPDASLRDWVAMGWEMFVPHPSNDGDS